MRLRLLPFLLLPALAAACHHAAEEPAGPAKPDDEAWLDPGMDTSGIVVEPVAKVDVPTRLITSGTTAYVFNKVAHVFSPVSGEVQTLNKNLGDKVYKGEALCLINSPDIGSAQSDLNKADADKTAAEAKYDRMKALADAGGAAKADLEAAQDAYNDALAEWQRALEKLTALQGSPDGGSGQFYVQTSPIAGEVVARQASKGLEVEGTLSAASVATELYTIGDLHQMWAWLNIYESDLAQIELGDVAYLTVPGEGIQVTGKIDFISAQVDPNAHTLQVRVTFDNTGQRVRADSFTEAVLDTGMDHVLAVPLTAVVQDGDDKVIFVQRTDNPLHFVRVPVTVKIETALPLPAGPAPTPASMPSTGPASMVAASDPASSPASAPVVQPSGTDPSTGGWAEILAGNVKEGDPVVIKGALELVGLE
jgi:cobalt-zinc-cadmium efflux system membrane fusion protein